MGRMMLDRKASSIALFATLFLCVLASAHNVRLAKTMPDTIYVNGYNTSGPWDGTELHPYQNITSGIKHTNAGDTVFVSSGTYKENATIEKSISLVGQDPFTTILDGNGSDLFVIQIFNTTEVTVCNFTVQNTTLSGISSGVLLYETTNVTIQNLIVRDNWYGISVGKSTTCEISDNKIMHNYAAGIVFGDESCYNKFISNTITENPEGVISSDFLSKGNIFYRNNFLENMKHIEVAMAGPPTWDNGVEGNYWDDYEGTDYNGDGIGDTNLPHLWSDERPLMEPWNITRTYMNSQVIVKCNCTLASFNFSEQEKQISFYITGPAGWSGFCNVTISKAFLNPEPLSEKWIVTMGNPVAFSNISLDGSTLLSFTYTLGASMQFNMVRIRASNLYAPTASFQFAPDPASTIEPVNFTDTSTKGNGTIIWRRWDFGDGYVVDNDNMTFVSHPFSSKALFNVTLTVRDDNSLTDSVTLPVWVRNLLPSADFSFSPTNPSVGLSVSFDASDSTDLDGGIVEYRWDFGDSTMENTASPTVTHRFGHVGTYNVTLTAVDGDGEESRMAQIISVGKGATHIDIDAPTSAKVEEQLTMNAALIDEDGRPLAGKQIRIEVYDGDLDFSKNVDTDALGIASTTLSLNATGQYVVRASYVGSIDYLASESTSALEVTLMATSLELHAPENATQSREIILSATLLDEDGNPIYNATVEFHANNGSAWMLLGSAQTSQSGIASLSHTLMHAGTYTLKAVYNGDGKNAASTSSEQSLEVAASEVDYTPYIILAAVIASAIVILLTVFTRRRGKGSQSDR